jgi:hypothetical protein
VKIDLESLTVLESRLREELRSAWRDRKRLGHTDYELGSGEPIGESSWTRDRIVRSIRVPLAGLRAIQLARRTVSAMDELEAKYGVKVSK